MSRPSARETSGRIKEGGKGPRSSAYNEVAPDRSGADFFWPLLLAGGSSARQAEPSEVKLTPKMDRIHEGLAARATARMERFGTTFYALGLCMTPEEKIQEVVPIQSAPLEPRLVGENLKSAIREPYSAKAAVCGVAIDHPEDKTVQIELENSTGLCRRVWRSYRFEQSGRVTFLAPRISTCEASIFALTN